MQASKMARGWFGDAFVDHFALVCEAEHASLARTVSPEEVRRYLEGG
jgi:glutamine synthetase